MTKRKHVKPVERKGDRLKNFILIVMQALFCAFIGLSVFIYRSTSPITIEKDNTSYIPSFQELSVDYYNSDNFKTNFMNSMEEVIRFMVIREQLETNGSYNAKKEIPVAAYSHRTAASEYYGPDAVYYLDDLIRWAQRGVSRDYKMFWSEQSLNDYFNGIDNSDMEYISKSESDEIPYVSFSAIINQYQSIEGKNLEEYATSIEEYETLSTALKSTINSLYSNYREYLDSMEKYDNGNSNIKYYFSMTVDGKKQVYTNVSGIKRSTPDSEVLDTFKNYGEYLYILPGKLDFLTNMSITYDEVKNLLLGSYSYAFPDDTCFWISIDKELPVEDVFYSNYMAFFRTGKLIPWIVSLSIISGIGFVAFFHSVVIYEKRKWSYVGAAKDLSEFDKLPLEFSLLICALLAVLLYMGENLILKNFKNYVSDYTYIFIPATVLLAIDVFLILIIVYGFIRRIICHNLFDMSLIGVLAPLFKKLFERLNVWFWRVYDSAGVAIRTWLTYVFFMIFNLFWALMLFFGENQILAFVVLAVFDVAAGAILFNRNYERKQIVDGLKQINAGDYDFKIDVKKLHGENRELALAVNNIGQGIQDAVAISIKDEKMKADLITNVSHDIKTPLTSIINYVDLLKREKIEDERVAKYIQVLDDKSQRLKQLTFDLVEASKITSGNIEIDLRRINYVELMEQAIGEFEEKFEEKKLNVVTGFPDEPVYIMADPRHMWRVVENLFNNACKYAQPDTRVYLDLTVEDGPDGSNMVMSLKNISGQQLNIPANELTERFIRGDVSRSTEGSGLGLSIAKSLTTIQKGTFNIYLDGDLFKVTLTFPIAK